MLRASMKSALLAEVDGTMPARTCRMRAEMNSKKAWIGALFSMLPVTLFFPVGVMYLMIAAVTLLSVAAVAWPERRTLVVGSPLTLPFALLAIFVVLQALLQSAGVERRFTGTVHYFVFVFFLLFIALQEQRWYLTAKKALFAGALYAAAVFALAKAGVLPDWHIFKNYLAYGGNKSISLGIFMAIAAAWMLNDAAAATDRRAALGYLLAYLCVAAAVILFAVTRTGALLLVLLSALVILRWVTLGWRALALMAVVAALLLGAWKTGGQSIERLQRTADAVIAFTQGKQGSGESNRLQFIEPTFEMLPDKPLLGHGIGSWQQQYPVRAQGLETAFMSTPHNDYLLYAAELGIVGLLLLGLIFVSLLRAAIKAPNRSGNALLLVTVALIVGSMFNAILRDWRFGVPFMLMLAIAYREMLVGIGREAQTINPDAASQRYDYARQ